MFRGITGRRTGLKFFRQDEGRYVSKGIPGMQAGRGAVRMIFIVMSVAVLSWVYTSSSRIGIGMEMMLPVIIAASIILLGSVLSAVLRIKGRSSGVAVDLMKGTITYRRPGGMHTVPVSSLREIGLQTSGGNTHYGSRGKQQGALLYLLTKDDKRLPLAFTSNGYRLRQVADELSIITSLTVNEHSGRKN